MLTKAEILREVEKFYGQLYTSVNQPVRSSAEDPRAEFTRHYSEDIPDIILHEINMALRHLKINKALGENGITSDLLKAGRTSIFKTLQTIVAS